MAEIQEGKSCLINLSHQRETERKKQCMLIIYLAFNETFGKRL